MTRDFNKPKRDDSRPPFRNASPNRNRDERSPRPARPRLNRETVDRAWESGAQQQHADYRPRTAGGPARPQGQRPGGWSNNSNSQQSGGYSSQNGRGGSRPYNNNRQDTFRDNRSGNYRDDRDRRDSRDTPRNFERPQGTGNSPRPARPPYGQDRRDSGGQRFENRRDSFNAPNRRDGDSRQQFQDRGNQRRDFGRNDRPTRNADEGQRETSHPRWQSRPSEQRNNARGPERDFNSRSGGERFEGDYEHFEERDTRPTRSTERQFEPRPSRPTSKPFEGQDARGSRSSRPTERSFEARDSRDARPPRPVGKSFEDHDSYDARPPRPIGRPFSGSRIHQNQSEHRGDDRKNEAQPERHVTRLPDGRVLKGPRPVQRKNAQFWTGVTNDTSELVGHISETKPNEQTQEVPTSETPENATGTTPEATINAVSPSLSEEAVATDQSQGEVVTEETPVATPTQESVSEVAPPKRRTRTASAVTRVKKPRSTGPKPSQRGFKWPTQE